MKHLVSTILLVLCISSCEEKSLILKPVSYADFEAFVSTTDYVTDAEKYGWSIVQTDVYNFVTVEQATWRLPDGMNDVSSGKLPVTQVSYNDAVAYCKWAGQRLPSYEEYWDVVTSDNRIIVSENLLSISEVDKVNIVGNVWDITGSVNFDSV